MTENADIKQHESDIANFFCAELANAAKDQGWTRDSQWTDWIHKRMAEIGHRFGFLVFASQSRCPTADGPEWLYDHHWRVPGANTPFVSIPLVMEIEWGSGVSTIFEKITEDFMKLVQARGGFRVMVFQCNDVVAFTDKLISMADAFEGSQRGDRWLFVGWDWATHQIHCKSWVPNLLQQS